MTSLGANQFVDYSNEDFTDVVEPCDLVVDMLGGETLAKSFEVVAYAAVIGAAVRWHW